MEPKVALVTAGSRGIGAAIARPRAGDGADVAITYREAVVADVESAGRRGCAIQVDAADSAAVAEVVEGVAVDLGRLEILVNNAGVFLQGRSRR